ncbi:efflux RND transporter periplasmic adaptor subunit [Burkholderia pseudomultivorans]|uniref:efflux RND transporter periplasmic adaptor subunit n=1 Tax=Burkholderia pseudomultivorans TaxID=1207504 RepID=UPI002874476D|nr:efflux RND transporter periplasmic adaptor subunit [Burkholderia pseudomultivorans]MDS0862753.1 efflux RND transporter periplasmic adaptor subunit [Burkholderia pseudomultivorans]
MKNRLESGRFGQQSAQSSDGRLRQEPRNIGVPVKSISLLFVTLLTLSALSGCGKSRHGSAVQPPQVGVITVQPQSIALRRDLVGRLAPYLSANVMARVSGVLTKRVYKEGSDVKAGQVLFEIDPAYYQAQLNNDLGILSEDEATWMNDKANAARYHKLLPVGSVSQQTVDNADATVRSDAAKVKADEATVESAKVNLSYTKVTSPIHGIAGQQQVTVGAVVGSSTADAGSGGTLLTTVNEIDQLYVNFTMSAADLLMLREASTRGDVALSQPDGTTVQITLPDGSAYAQPGTLDFSDVSVNSTTGAVNLRALVPNPQRTLLPGMYVTLNVTLGQQRNVFLVPQEALQRDTVGAYVFVVNANGKVAREDVAANDSIGTDWIVTRGLAAGNQVIVSGLQGLHEGDPVKPHPWHAPSTVALQAGSALAAGSRTAVNAH